MAPEPPMAGFRLATCEDAVQVAEIFAECFSEGIRNHFPDGLGCEVLETIWRFLLDASPSICVVAYAPRERRFMLGYCLVQASVGQLVGEGLTGLLPELVGMVRSGDIPLGWHQVESLLRDLVGFGRSFSLSTPGATGQVLSVGVRERARGRGLGTQLVRRGLQRLYEEGIYSVKLEVRPDNEPARRIYERLGFEVVGCTEDSVGKWLVMIKEEECEMRPDDS